MNIYELNREMTDEEVNTLFFNEIKRHNNGDFTIIRRDGRSIILKAIIEFRLPKKIKIDR